MSWKKSLCAVCFVLGAGVLLMAAVTREFSGFQGVVIPRGAADDYFRVLDDYGTGKSLLLQNTATTDGAYMVTTEDAMLVRSIRTTTFSGTGAIIYFQRNGQIISAITSRSDVPTWNTPIEPPWPLTTDMAIFINNGSGLTAVELHGTHLTSPFNGGDLMVVK